MTKITISSESGYHGNTGCMMIISNMFSCTLACWTMLSFNCEKNINIIRIFDFSQNLRPKMGLIDPSPLVFSGVLRGAGGRHV